LHDKSSSYNSKKDMNIFDMLGIKAAIDTIDMQMTPVDTYGLFECRGDMHRVRSNKERYYYFFIDNWRKPATLCFMERGIRHANVLATIKAPQKMIDNCVVSQGMSSKENSYAIDESIRQWLKKNILTRFDVSKVSPVEFHQDPFTENCLLPKISANYFVQQKVFLPYNGRVIHESEIPSIIKKYDFFENAHNPKGSFRGCLRQTEDDGTAVDLATGIRWQLCGSDIGSFRQLQSWIKETNQKKVAEFQDWRLPTVEESLSLLRGEKGKHGSYIHPCFDFKQGYIYTVDRRKPGGYWFVDFRQARVYWASGTMAGGFGRLCRSEYLPGTAQY